MSDEKHRVSGDLIFNDDESYEAYKKGAAVFNNGLRRDDGTLYRQPDFEEGYEEDESGDEYSENSEENLLYDLISKGFFLILGFAGGVIATKAVPKVKNWWKTSVTPAIKSKLNLLRRKEGQNVVRVSATTKVATVKAIDDELLLPVSSQQIDDIYEEYKRNITSEEAQKEFLEIFILCALLAKKVKTLSESNIIDRELLVEKVTSKEFIKDVNQILLKNPDLLKEKADTLSEITGRAAHKEGVYIPIECDELKQQLRRVE